jgi:2-hydroxychromene-2-carboxylate isomerase
MGKTLEFLFDFASPNAYFAWRALPPILERTGAKLKVTPTLLGGLFKLTGNQAPMTAFGGIKGKLDYEMLETRRFVARHGLERFRMNPHFPMNTIVPMRTLVGVSGTAHERPLIEAVLTAAWETGENIGDGAVLQGVLDRAGLPGAELVGRTQDPAVKQALMDATQAGADRGAFGIPTFFVGDEMFFGKERLEQIERELAA